MSEGPRDTYVPISPGDFVERLYRLDDLGFTLGEAAPEGFFRRAAYALQAALQRAEEAEGRLASWQERYSSEWENAAQQHERADAYREALERIARVKRQRGASLEIQIARAALDTKEDG